MKDVVCHMPHVDSYLLPPPPAYFLSLIYSEHDNTQLVCVINFGMYKVEHFTHVVMMYIDLRKTVMRLHNHVV